MSDDFRSARYWARELIERAMFPGAHAVDATMGNGHDTKWLCELAGETGTVYAFDVQAQAVENTRARLAEAGLLSRARLFHAGHERMAEFVDHPSDAIVFNLGWLPGGEKTVTTLTDTTIAAVSAATELLAPGGLMTICIYPGHAEGAHGYRRAHGTGEPGQGQRDDTQRGDTHEPPGERWLQVQSRRGHVPALGFNSGKGYLYGAHRRKCGRG